MILSDWINNIRWKYFTNNKSGLIFKELMKEFGMVEQMTEKRYLNIIPSGIQDTETGNIIRGSKIGDLLNKQDKTIQEYKHLVKIATSLIEWNTIPQVRREWKKHLSKVGDVDD